MPSSKLPWKIRSTQTIISWPNVSKRMRGICLTVEEGRGTGKESPWWSGANPFHGRVKKNLNGYQGWRTTIWGQNTDFYFIILPKLDPCRNNRLWALFFWISPLSLQLFILHFLLCFLDVLFLKVSFSTQEKFPNCNWNGTLLNRVRKCVLRTILSNFGQFLMTW